MRKFLTAIAAIAGVILGAILLSGCKAATQEKAKSALEKAQNLAPSEAQMIEALKVALTDGAEGAAASLAKSGGFTKSAYKIPLPSEAAAIEKNIKLVPGGEKLAADTTERINLAAEAAATKAAPIFAKAIKDMSVKDAAGILRGGDNAATEYLRAKTGGDLRAAFKPEIKSALNAPIALGVSAQSSWDTLTNAYNTTANSIVGKAAKLTPVKTSLEDFALDKALDAMFSEVAKSEAEVRADPLSSAKSVVRNVFSYAKTMK
ncbi:MAG: DUF4197 domain-containing protein [Helicobacteraceae bacterium]|jgi:hypothetical protein|nr:DUF4197 domain-containing protein [Helicobacteraceae bacterium]